MYVKFGVRYFIPKYRHKFQDLRMLTDYEAYFTHVPPDTFKQPVFQFCILTFLNYTYRRIYYTVQK